MNKVMTRVTLLVASTLGLAVVGMGGIASASSINVSTQGPNSGVYITSGSGSWGNGSNWHDSNDWNEDQGGSQCQGNWQYWTNNKVDNCCKNGWKKTYVKVNRSCRNWLRRFCL